MQISMNAERSFRGLFCAAVLAVLAACAAPPPSKPAPAVPVAKTAPKPPAPPAAPAVKPEPAPPAPEAAPPEIVPEPAPPPPAASPPDEIERGRASWYGPRFHGRRAANGERYDMHALTAAHKTLPFNTLVLVRSLENGREVVVRITDRGRLPGRIIDLSRAAARELDMLGAGLMDVVLIDVSPDPQSRIAPVVVAPPALLPPLSTGP